MGKNQPKFKKFFALRPAHRGRQSTADGFSLIETLVTVAILALIMGATSAFILMSYRTYGYTWRQSIVMQEARRGVEIMVKEIRGARNGDNGSYPIEKAADKEFIFYSDIDSDGQAERVRYFLGTENSGTQSQECATASQGGACSVAFSNFLTGNLKSAQVKVSVDGDVDAGTSGSEDVSISTDGGVNLGALCTSAASCLHCAETWQGTTAPIDVTAQASDNQIQFTAQGNSNINKECPTASPTYSMKARFELSWTEEIVGAGNELEKGVTEPVVGADGVILYPLGQEKTSVLSSYIRNAPPIFEYFDASGNKILDYPTRLADTKVMKVYLVVNADPNRPPQDFGLESSVELRNLKEE